MHYDFGSSIKREGWLYSYTGAVLLPYAHAAYIEYLRAEMQARERMSKMIVNINISQAAGEVEQIKRDIEKNGKLREQCEVFVHEFKRYPDREFSLGLGDVTFFGLVGEPSDEDLEHASFKEVQSL